MADLYTMFPIQDMDAWTMYKKQVDCFWRVEEVDLSKDMIHWKQLTDPEQHFLSMIVGHNELQMVLFYHQPLKR